MPYTLPDIPANHFLLIKTDGSEELRRFPTASEYLNREKRGQPGTNRIQTMVDALGFDTLDFSTLTKDAWGRAKLIMVVNDFGWQTVAIERPGRIELVPTVANFPINRKATDLYRATAPNSVFEIVGDVLILNDDD